jgi:tRNA pseudouridine32 synthase/23S rRNA pseudouridine746 synthase
MNSAHAQFSSRVYLPADQSYPDLLSFFCAHFPHIPSAEWQERFCLGLVQDENQQTLAADDPYCPGVHLRYFKRVNQEPQIPFEEEIIFENERLLVADKPHFLPVTPSGQYLMQTLLNRLRVKTGNTELSPLHRIDRDTAGLVVFAKRAGDRALYQNLFRDRHIQKIYEAIAPYQAHFRNPRVRESRLEPGAHFLQMIEVDGSPNTHTLIEYLEHQGMWARYRLIPTTGKKHQLRVHMNALDIPIKNDAIYPTLTPFAGTDLPFDRPLQLLAKSLSFIDPIDSQSYEFHSRQVLRLQ